MTSIRFYSDFELQMPIGTVFIPQRTPYTIIQSANVQWQRTTEITVYDENEESRVAATVHSIARLNGLVASESVLKQDNNNFPLDAFEALTVTGSGGEEQARNLAVMEAANPRYAYTEGRTRFQVLYGESDTHILIALSPADMYTNGPDADTQGFQRALIHDYFPFVGYNTAGSIFQISKSVYRSDFGHRPRIAFFSNAYRFAEEDDGRQIIGAVLMVQPLLSDSWTIYSNSTYPRMYTSDVFEGVSGYVPEYVPTNSNVNRGGSGNGMYPHSAPEGTNWAEMVTVRNNAFSASMGDGRCLTWYKMEPAAFVRSLSFLYGTGWNALFSEKRINAYISAYQIPVDVAAVQTGRFWLADDSRNMGSLACGYIQYPLVTKSFAALNLTNYGWDDWNDFSNTRASLYLPFVGRINVDVNAFIRGSIRMNALIDVRNGNIGYWVYTRSMQGDEEVLYGIYTGNCAVQMPISGIYRGNILGHIVNAGSSFAAGDTAAFTKSVIGFVDDVHVSKAGSVDTSSSSISPYQPRLDIERREMLRVDNYQEVEGIPSFIAKKFNELHGFVKVQSATYEMLSCEQSEKEQIRELLESGVYV